MKNKLLQRLNLEVLDDRYLAFKVSLVISKMLDLKLSATDIETSKLNIRDLPKSLMLKDVYYIITLSEISNGMAYFLTLTDMASTDELLCYLTGKHIKIMNGFENSVICEIANIMLGTFISEVTRRLDLWIRYTAPQIIIDTPDVLRKLFSDGSNYNQSELHISKFRLISEDPPIEIIASLISPSEW